MFLLLLLFNVLVIKCKWNILMTDSDVGFDPYHLEKIEPYQTPKEEAIRTLTGDVDKEDIHFVA